MGDFVAPYTHTCLPAKLGEAPVLCPRVIATPYVRSECIYGGMFGLRFSIIIFVNVQVLHD